MHERNFGKIYLEQEIHASPVLQISQTTSSKLGTKPLYL